MLKAHRPSLKLLKYDYCLYYHKVKDCIDVLIG
jgi:hypothetical protein